MAKPRKDPKTPTSDLIAKVSPANLGMDMGRRNGRGIYSNLPRSQHIRKPGSSGGSRGR